jgi:hypothetical protein
MPCFGVLFLHLADITLGVFPVIDVLGVSYEFTFLDFHLRHVRPLFQRGDYFSSSFTTSHRQISGFAMVTVGTMKGTNDQGQRPSRKKTNSVLLLQACNHLENENKHQNGPNYQI